MKANLRPFLTAMMVALVAGASCLLLQEGGYLGRVQAAAAPQLKLQTAPVNRDARAGMSYAPVVKKASPSVVNIYTTKIIRGPQRMNPLFEYFFGGPDGFGGGPSQPQPAPRSSRREGSLGSGVIVTEDGYLLTNNHVIDGADEIRVALADGNTEYTAKLVGADPQTDLAVLKIEAKNLPAIVIADSDQLEVGDVVVAIGNPFGVGQTVTMGIVSAKDRSGFGLAQYEDYIQTDASINPGNSGGALVDAEGRLVGINTWIISRSGGSQGIGFAIPSNLARSVLEMIATRGKVTRGYLGVMVQSLTPDLAREFKVPEKQGGALVGEVNEGTPAAAAGLKEGDVIVEFNGKPVMNHRQLTVLVASTPPDTKAKVTVLRGGKEQTLAVTLGELPGENRAGGLRRSGESGGQDTLDGVEVADLDARARSQFDIPANVRGALVTQIDPDSSCYRAGLREGHVILEINRKPVRNADDAVKLSDGLTGRVLLRVWSDGGSRYMTVDGGQRRE